jgi:AAA domain
MELLDTCKSKEPTGTHELIPAGPSLQHAEDHIFERVSVARDHELLTEALRYGRGHIQHDELNGPLLLRESAGELLRDGSEVATNASLERERDMIACVNRGIGACKPLGADGVFIASDRLRPEQKRAIMFVLGSRDRVTGVRGAAGTGKTATLQELRRGTAEANVGILAVAPTVSAVEELQKAGFPDAATVERLLQDRRMNEEVSGKAIIVDEAGMLSSRQMSEMLRLAEGSDARLVLCGDTKQIQSVEAGDALRVLESESRLKMASLTEVQRQTDQAYRQAIESLRRNPNTGFDRLDQIGAVQEVAAAERAEVVALAYLESRTLRNRSGQPRSTLVVCATHAEIDRVTGAIRGASQKAGDLGTGYRLVQDVPLGWTTAQKCDPRNFKAGQIIEFHRPTKGVAKNEVLEVVRREQEHIVARTAAGEERKITRKQAQAFDVFERRPIEIAAGDRLLLTANRRGASFRATNGELVTVSRVDAGGQVHLGDGRTLPEDYRHFVYGYAVTAHRSQGKSVDAVVISADGMRKELFYVAASRGREGISVITSDKEALRESVGCSPARKSATELARNAAGRLERGIHRGMAAARDLVWRARHWALPAVGTEVLREPRMERRHEISLGR